MKKTSFIVLMLMAVLTIQAQTNALTLQEVVGGAFRAENIQGFIPIPGDGEHYTQMNAEGTQIIKYSFKTGKQVEVLFDAATARECPFKNFDSYTFSPDGMKLLIATETTPIYRHSYTAVHYLYSLRRNVEGKINNVVERLSEGGPQQAPVFSPDGNLVAFVRDNNIFLIKTHFGNSESQVTEDGKFNQVLNGIPDWVYEEEFAFNSAIEFSADSKMLAFIRWDESEVPSYSFPLYAGERPRLTEFEKYPGAYTYKYPKTGEVNSKVSVHTFDIQTRVTRQMDVPLDKDGYIPRIRFTKDPEKLAIMTLNRHQNRFDLYFCNPRSKVCKLVLRDETDTYIKERIFDEIHFYDQNFSFVSEKSGFNHLYWYNMNGTLVKQITSGNYELKEFLGYDEADGSFYYSSNEESPLQQAIYKVDRKGKKTKLSANVGTNSAQFSSNMKYYLNRFSNTTTPTVVTLNDNSGKVLTTLIDNAALKEKLSANVGTNSAQFSSNMKYYLNRFSNTTTPTVVTLNDNSGKVLTTLIDNAALKEKLSARQLPQTEFFSFTTERGTELNGWMMKPTDFQASKKYPVLMYQYSGPGSQEVLDHYSVSWETYMASQGFIVVCVDGRGTGGRGAEFEKCTYLNLGVKEAEDQVSAAKY
ncbi:MAG: S9 family peptidase, partial [Bacteroides sp.]|nr:S9 family peptidase [Bacteroides sp.]